MAVVDQTHQKPNRFTRAIQEGGHSSVLPVLEDREYVVPSTVVY